MAKGGEWEREVAKRLTQWITGKRSPPVLWRSTQSGGWANKGSEDYGDLTAKGEEGRKFLSHFTVECKHYKEIEWWKAFSSKDTFDVWAWWYKLNEECMEAKTAPMLVIKRNYYPPLVGVPSMMLSREIKDNFTVSLELNASVGWPDTICFSEMEEFLNTIKPKELYTLSESWLNTLKIF